MKQKTLDVVGIGACNLDNIAFVPKFPEVEEKINATGYVPPRAAGVALDAVTQTAYLGARCGFIGKMGDDALGKIFLRDMEADQIDCSQVEVVPGELTSQAWVMVIPASGERCHVIIPMGTKGLLQAEDIDKRKAYIQSARVCHMEMLQNPIDPMIRSAEYCREAGTLVSFDLDIAPRYLYEYKYATEEKLKRMFALTDILKACKNAIPDLTKATELEEAARDILEMGPGIVIITAGEQGCVVAYREQGEAKSLKSPAFTDTPVKDTTGAGDAFQGGFIYGVLRGWPMERCAALANACGYLKSLRIGARNMPPRAEVDAFLRKKGWPGVD